MHEAAPYYPSAFYKALSYHNNIITKVVSNVFMCSFCSSVDGLRPAVQYPIDRAVLGRVLPLFVYSSNFCLV
jgi:hypothetical protein